MLASSFQTVVMVNHGHEKKIDNDDDKHHHKISVIVATKMALKSNP